ncbi:hypothetical protein NHX12_006406 [Muraenolepis orangiensis]|uniref:Uncharacterized protein n=1 Tax=Muraenolepis orangiensis TaxID=630683 RepID=A0A9Q0DT73_9TELE|nr:hypothetical protein NHX12_006406 [Muraenolepis orangiensis]
MTRGHRLAPSLVRQGVCEGLAGTPTTALHCQSALITVSPLPAPLSAPGRQSSDRQPAACADPEEQPGPSGALDCCSKFLYFFQAKVDSIHQQLHFSLSTFTPVDTLMVAKLVTKAKAFTCSLDPMPTALVKASLPIICPIIVTL